MGNAEVGTPRADMAQQTARDSRVACSRMQESFNALRGIALGAAAASRSTPTASPPGLPSSDALEAAFNTLDCRTTALSAAVHSLTADFTLCSAQVSELVRLSALQYVAPAQHSSLRLRALRMRHRQQLAASHATDWDGH